MAEKSLNAILKMRYDSYTNWMSANPILKKGETAVVLVESESADVQPIVLSKIGNGTDTFSALPWSSANAADVYEWAKQENKPTYTASEVGAVSYIENQSLTETQKKTARSNIGAGEPIIFLPDDKISYQTTSTDLDYGSNPSSPINDILSKGIGNVFELVDPSWITVETYSNSTWSNSTITDSEKIKLFMLPVVGLTVNTTFKINSGLRITIYGNAVNFQATLTKALVQYGASGSDEKVMSIDTSTDGNTWTNVIENRFLSSKAGWASIGLENILFGKGGSRKPYIRFTFMPSGTTTNSAYILKILVMGRISRGEEKKSVGIRGHLYSYDYLGNAKFPGNVSATKFIGDGSGLTNLPSSGGATEYTATIPSTGWTQNTENESYSVEVAVTGLKADYSTAPIVDFDTSGYTNMSMLKSDLALWAKVLKITTAAGKIIVYANEQPGTELPIRIKVIE